MTSPREPRLADAAEIAAEQGLTSARVTHLYNTRDENGFPEIAGMQPAREAVGPRRRRQVVRTAVPGETRRSHSALPGP